MWLGRTSFVLLAYVAATFCYLCCMNVKLLSAIDYCDLSQITPWLAFLFSLSRPKAFKDLKPVAASSNSGDSFTGSASSSSWIELDLNSTYEALLRVRTPIGKLRLIKLTFLNLIISTISSLMPDKIPDTISEVVLQT